MKALFYRLLFFTLYLISLLPFPVLYFISDILYLIIFKVIGYRNKVITRNLENSFPEKSKKEIDDIREKFNRHFCDLFVEILKSLSISKKELIKRCQLRQKEVFDAYHENKQSIICVLGHYGNWEWAGPAFGLVSAYDVYAIYKPLSNTRFDGFFYKMRTRFGTHLISMNTVIREMLKNREKVTVTAFIADQTPMPENAIWLSFLNQDTPVFTGTEKIARRFNYPVIFMKIRKIKRGFYEIIPEVLTENPSQTIDGEITELHTRALEKEIMKTPEIWLWSHRRWKHSRPETNKNEN